ncbi:MAG: flagellar basal body rod C-terminal domain-containing protein [Thermodesulfobacteriota bacterium]|nr:flagellar basal body rod C-terminal domain-containing protein [Thermodesulfobacteriota bacterium]
MFFSVDNTIAALRAFGKKMQVISNNIANVNTDGFKRSRAHLVNDKNDGVTVTISREGAAETPASDPSEGQNATPSNVSLAEEVPQSIATQRYYEANVKTLKVKDEMTKSVIDIIE